MRNFIYVGLILVPVTGFGAGCASKGAAGSETHFVCSKDADCRPGSQCVENHCEASENGEDAGGGSSGGAPNGNGGAGNGSGPAESTGGGPGNGAGGGPIDGTGGSGRGGAGGSLPDGTGGSQGSGVACPVSDDVAPLDDGCTDEVCHVAIRLDYETLTPHGYASVGGPAQAPDQTAALAAAKALFETKLEYPPPSTSIAMEQAGVFRAYASPSDFGAFALVGARSGKMITAGSIIWAGAGHYAAPVTWKPASDIACSTGGAAGLVLKDSFFDIPGAGGCDFAGRLSPTAQEAANLALRTNLALHYAERGPFSAFTYLYLPSVGNCNPDIAEYIVVLTSGPQ